MNTLDDGGALDLWLKTSLDLSVLFVVKPRLVTDLIDLVVVKRSPCSDAQTYSGDSCTVLFCQD